MVGGIGDGGRTGVMVGRMEVRHSICIFVSYFPTHSAL